MIGDEDVTAAIEIGSEMAQLLKNIRTCGISLYSLAKKNKITEKEIRRFAKNILVWGFQNSSMAL